MSKIYTPDAPMPTYTELQELMCEKTQENGGCEDMLSCNNCMFDSENVNQFTHYYRNRKAREEGHDALKAVGAIT